jgi:uncharacterized protein (TIGR04255 family)
MDAPHTSHELVSFDHPPVQEIAFSIQLIEPLSLEAMVDIGRALDPSFPVRQLQPALPRMVAPDVGQPFSFLTTIGVQLPRFWFVSQDGLRLVQVQEDRVAFNWRRLGRDVLYPRYGTLRGEFAQILAKLTGLVPELTNETLAVDFCELTYVNELAPAEPRRKRLPLETVLRVVRPLPDGEFLPDADDAQWTGSWTIVDSAGARAGRLTASAQPGLRQVDEQPIYLLTMSSALPGRVSGTGAVFDRLDVAHEWIVRGFADLTTKDMHDQWRRTR